MIAVKHIQTMYRIDNYLTKELYVKFSDSYHIGSNTAFLKIRSANDKGRSDNRKRILEEALRYPYIQPNTSYNLRWFVFDIDRVFDLNEIFEKNLPEPNYIVWNPENLHAHLWYGLKNPIYQQEQFKKSKPVKYAKVVYNSLSKELAADTHFNRTLCKNPLHPAWNTIILKEEYYSLSEISSHLDINWNDEEPRARRKNINLNPELIENYSGVEKGSRNSALFEYVRHLAYKHRKIANCTEEDFIEWCIGVVKKADEKNPCPLALEVKGEKELLQIGISVGKWTWMNLDPLKISKTAQYNDAARCKSLSIRRRKAIQKIKRIAKFLKTYPNASNREISRKLGEGFSTDTVNKAVRKIKAEKKDANEKSKASRDEVVALVPSNILLIERFVNQVVVVFVFLFGFSFYFIS